MEKKYGVYICKGCGIGDSIDIEKLAKSAKSGTIKEEDIKTHDILCSPEGLQMIKGDIKKGVNTLIIAACSPRVKYDEFDFPGCIVERVNIREFVAWTQPPKTDDTQALAEDYLTIGAVKAQKSDLPAPNILENLSNNILVIGGGISGMTAALESAKAGYKVVLVEKEAQLGGFANKLYKKIPTRDYKEPVIVDTEIDKVIKEVESHPNIKVYKSAKVEKTEGQPGLFDVTIASSDGVVTEKIGAIVLATGWIPYDATKLGHLGYGKYKDVVTNIEFEQIAKSGAITRPSDGKEAKKVAFIQCAGSRDPNHLPYCSSMCCATSLKQARYVRQKSDAIAMILYKDMRTPGRLEAFYKEAQNDPGVMLTKGEVTGVTDAGNGNLYVMMENSLLGEKVKVEADLVVLATGMVPTTRAPQEYLDGLTEAGTKGDEAKKAYLDSTPKPEFILNLTYRQGPEIPSLPGAYGFADSNFICFQYETRRTGIYAAGPVRQPMNMTDAQEDAAGAAFKAIQCIDHVSKGVAVHPRAWDLTFPDPQLIRCTACKRCTEECPFGAIDEDAKGIPFYKVNRCRRCGTCMGACPERIVSFKDYSIDIIGSAIKSIEVEEEEFRIVCLVCENDAYPALDTLAIQRKQIDPSVRFIPLRCLGGMHLVWIADAFSKGIDGFLLLGCKFGENYQCHFVKGSELANTRFSKVGETLNKLQLEADRVKMIQVAIDEYHKLPDMINEFAEKVKEIGHNPFKEF
ncbi:MAG: hydrogenase iron-sulfur subunit [Nitrospirae bacterium]|jgi:quinone-modifying oxidoreductase subunit QmoB|nr:hydrogenase iron-sulfur subunit [Nitrospirota bacterium]